MIPYEFTEKQSLNMMLELGMSETGLSQSPIGRDYLKLQKVLKHPDNKPEHDWQLARFVELFNKKWK